jgi:hypothetical protein
MKRESLHCSFVPVFNVLLKPTNSTFGVRNFRGQTGYQGRLIVRGRWPLLRRTLDQNNNMIIRFLPVVKTMIQQKLKLHLFHHATITGAWRSNTGAIGSINSTGAGWCSTARWRLHVIASTLSYWESGWLKKIAGNVKETTLTETCSLHLTFWDL